MNEEIPLWSWFARGFAGVLHFSALEKIWDKVIGGSIKLLAYVAVSRVELAQNVLLGCQTANEGIRCLTKISEDDAMVAQKAIEIWNKDGRQILAPGTNHCGSDKQKTQSASDNVNLPAYNDKNED